MSVRQKPPTRVVAVQPGQRLIVEHPGRVLIHSDPGLMPDAAEVLGPMLVGLDTRRRELENALERIRLLLTTARPTAIERTMAGALAIIESTHITNQEIDMAHHIVKSEPLAIRCPNCQETSVRAEVTVEGQPEPSNQTVTTREEPKAAKGKKARTAELEILGDVRGVAVTTLRCDSCDHAFLPST